MKKLLLATIATAALAIAPAVKASTIPYGQFSFNPAGGSVTYAGSDLSTATSVTLPEAFGVQNASPTWKGSTNIFANLTYGTTFNPGFNPTDLTLNIPVGAIGGGAVTYGIQQFLTWTDNGDTFYFALNTGTWTSGNAGFLNFVGLGTFSDQNNTYISGLSEISLAFNALPGSNGANYAGQFQVPPGFVPEPSSLVLLGTGLLGAAFLLFRRRRTAKNTNIA